MKVDILIGVAERGGVENIINMMIPVLQKERDWEIRVVQMIWEGYDWTTEGTAFYPLLYGKDGHTLQEFVDVYTGFLTDNGTPDIILATAWPYMCYVGKKAIAMLGRADIKVVSWVHTPVVFYEAGGFGGYPYLGLADAHLSMSEAITDGIRRHLPHSDIVPVKNPVDFDKCRVKKCKTERNNTKNLYFIGRITVQKQLNIIIKALKGVAEKWVLHVIGDGDEELKQELLQLAMEGGVAESIRWFGWQTEPWTCVENPDALVLASIYEGFPLVAIEALGNGIPVISTPVSGIVDVIRPGVNGYLYPMGDWKGLNEILRMIAENKFPVIDPENCKASVKEHEKMNALLDFADKIEKLML